MDLFDLIKGQLGEAAIGAIAGQLGGAKKEQTSSAVDSAMAVLMGALAKNTSNQEGASALGSALDRDHDGSILDDVMGYISGTSQVSNTKAANGDGILGHLLGEKRSGVIEQLSRESGLSQGQAGGLLAKLAPLILGGLGKQRKTQNMDDNGLSDLLSESFGQVAQKSPRAQSMIEKLIDRDGDGNIMDDIMGTVGKGLLKNLFK